MDNSVDSLLDKGRATVPGWTPEVGTRLQILFDRIGGISKAAKIAGTSLETLVNWRDGKARPAFFALSALAEAANISMGWLATGRGPMDADAEPFGGGGSVPELDERLLGRITDAIERVYQEESVSLPPMERGALIARKYKEILASVDPGDLGVEALQIAMVRMMANHLRKELQAAAAAPASSKRQASG